MSVSRETSICDVPRETRRRLDDFAALLLRWNKTINLTSGANLNELWRRHITDSLQLQTLMPPAASAMDLGSGAGFPGLVLAISSDVHFDLIEADQRKAAFLMEAARVTRAPVTVHPRRIENCDLPRRDILTARALASLPALLAYAERLLAPRGTALFMRGRAASQELAMAAAQGWSFDADPFPSVTGDGTVLRITGVRRA